MTNDPHMPGAWVCPKCGFILQKNILHARDGSVSADVSPLNEICPNDGLLMKPLTWRQANEELFEALVAARRRIAELESRFSLWDLGGDRLIGQVAQGANSL